MSEIVQVSLRGSRKEFFLNSRNLWLKLRDSVIVQGEHGDSLGRVFLRGHPVTLKMAREQQLSLNPGKISGACGRLMCCLAYELAHYRDSAERLPPVGTEIKTGKGIVRVTRTETYQSAVWVRDDEGGEHRI